MLVRSQIHGRCTKSILIVEDNDLLLDLLSQGFEMSGLRVIKAGNGIDGWHLFNRERIDIVLTDVQMPGLDGIELSRRIRRISAEITIALMTGGDEAPARELLDNGTVNRFFKKPFHLDHVCKSLAAG